MTRFVPYLAEEAIEHDAEALLAEYAQSRGIVVAPPIPIEEIVEKHLKLRVEFDDTHKLFGIPRESQRDADILGAIFFDERTIVIDESLDPEEYPWREPRYRYTAAHEGCGHWRLHRHLFVKDPAQALLFDDTAVPLVVCRQSRAKTPVEWQANFHASCVLMPRNLVFAVWEEIFPDRRPRIVQQHASINHPFIEVPRVKSTNRECGDFELNDELLDRVARPLAKRFLVSPTAMRIRLENLGLLLREVPRQRILINSV
jgi:Zn-dependent peptidase ImmA (M78 family)